MDRVLDLIDDSIQDLEPMIAEGFAYHQLKGGAHIVIDNVMRTALRSDTDPRLPKGFNYLGYRILTPAAEYKVRTKDAPKSGRGSKRRNIPLGYEFTKMDNYMVRFIFEAVSSSGAKEEITRDLLIPFVRLGGITHLRGVKYAVSAVMKTRGISPTKTGYFIEFQSSKLNIFWEHFTYLNNGSDEHIILPYSPNLHNGASRSTVYRPVLACWLFAKFGIDYVFENMLNCPIEAYEVNDPKLSEIDRNVYAICTTKKMHKAKNANIAFVVKKSDMTEEVKVFLGSALYIARAKPELVCTVQSVFNRRVWVMMLGYAIHKDVHNAADLIYKIESKHFAVIECMIDKSFHNELLREGIVVDSIYDLLFYVIGLFVNKHKIRINDVSQVWGRYLTVEEYVTYNLREAIYTTRNELVNVASNTADQSVGNEVNAPRIKQLINGKLITDLAESLNADHGEINAFGVATQNMFIGITSNCIDQTEAKKGSGKKSKIDLNSPANHFNEQFITTGSMFYLPKGRPIGLAKLNGNLKLSSRGEILPPERHVDIIQEAGNDLSFKGV